MAEINENKDTKDYLTTTQAARLLSVSPDTVLKWVKAGKVKSYRTLGGHFRIPASELDGLARSAGAPNQMLGESAGPLVHQYCWEYLAGGGDIKAECRECVTFRSRARRCYELKELPGGLGCLNLMCDTECIDCEYYKLVRGQGLNILVLSENSEIIHDIGQYDKTGDFRIKFCSTEYEAAVTIQSFRPDYVVVDCNFGRQRTGAICNSLFSDIRIPVAHIILTSKTRKIKDYCDKEVFGWIKRPFGVEQLKQCIQGVPRLVEKH